MSGSASLSNTINYLDTIRAISAGDKNFYSHSSASQGTDYPYSFVMFMDQMIHERKMKRKDIIARSGLDPDYAYKLLNGRKKTRERDYILALCIGAKLNIQQIQHALICSGMLPLSNSDIRSRIIIMGIQRGISVYQINDHLDEQHLPNIRTSGEMPSVTIADSFTWEPSSDNNGNSPVSRPSDAKGKTNQHTYTIDNISVEEGKKGPLNIVAEDYTGTAIVTDEDKNHYYLQFNYHFGDEDIQIYARTEEQYKKYCEKKELDETAPGECCQEGDFLESFNSMIDTTISDFFPCFIKIEDAIDRRVQQSINESDDTKYYGLRTNISVASQKTNIAVVTEYYNEADPELQEYFQLIRYTKGNSIFTISHESRFQELTIIYHYQEMYPEKKEHAFFFQADQQTIKNAEPRYKYYYLKLRYHMNQYLIQELNGFRVDKNTLYLEVLEYAAEQAEMCFYSKLYDEAWQCHLDAERVISYLSDPKLRLSQSSQNYYKMIITAERLQKNKVYPMSRTK